MLNSNLTCLTALVTEFFLPLLTMTATSSFLALPPLPRRSELLLSDGNVPGILPSSCEMQSLYFVPLPKRI